MGLDPVSLLSAGTSIVGGLIGSDSSRRAANTQEDMARQANGLTAEQLAQAEKRNAPFVQGGTQAFNALLDRLGLSGNTSAPGYNTFGRVPTQQEVMQTPGYQFGLEQGQRALDHQLAAGGMNYSGAALKAASRFGNDYATTKYGNAFAQQQGAQQQAYGQLMGAAGLGQGAAANTNALGTAAAGAMGQNLTGIGNVQGANALAQGNIWQNALNQGVSQYRNTGGGNLGIWQPGYDDTGALRGGWTGQH